MPDKTALETELLSKSNLTCDEAKTFLARLSDKTDEAKRELAALIDKLDVTGEKSKVTVLWAGTQDGKNSVSENLVPALQKDGARTLATTAAHEFLMFLEQDDAGKKVLNNIFGDYPLYIQATNYQSESNNLNP